MCYATKRKIADCMKHLMRYKDIRKITIQDIMDETGMSRQSFYYHFRDIYDVLEWVAEHDFVMPASYKEGQSIEDWVIQLLDVVRGERFFFERIVRQIEWPKIQKFIREPVEGQIRKMMGHYNASYGKLYPGEMAFCIDFFTTSICYYIMDFVYKRKKITNEEALGELHFLISMLEGSQLVEPMDRMGKRVVGG